MEIKFIVPGEVVGKGRPKFTTAGGYGRAYTPAKTRTYEAKVRNAFSNEYPAGVPLWQNKEPLEIIVIAYFQIPKSASKKNKLQMLNEGFPTKKPDADNILKSIADALNGVIYADDCQIVNATIVKRWSEDPRAEICIKDIKTD